MDNITENDSVLEDLRYPIGRFSFLTSVSEDDVDGWVEEIEQTPRLLQDAIADLTQEQLNISYRPEGWSLREVVHHLADAHMNGYIRFKLAMTEAQPIIKPYKENLWALLSDYDSVRAAVSAQLLTALHERWTALLRTMTPADFERVFIHPDSGETSLLQALQMYAWHGRHHIAHIVTCRRRMNW